MTTKAEPNEEDIKAAEHALYVITDDDCNMRLWPKRALAQCFAEYRIGMETKMPEIIPAASATTLGKWMCTGCRVRGVDVADVKRLCTCVFPAPVVEELVSNPPPEAVQVLDHGYLKLIETWGSDERIIESARMSTAKGFEGWGGEPCPQCMRTGLLHPPDGLFKSHDAYLEAKDSCVCKGSGKTTGDEKLLRYLYENAHATPFEFAGLVIEVQAPIFVFREWHRHRTQSYNEMSARYTPLPDLNYVPTVERLVINSKTNKQAGTIKGAQELTESGARVFQSHLREHYGRSEALYQGALTSGVPKELARIHLPFGRYSRMRAHTNLRNWLGFLTLRMAPNAQWEIQQYANAVGDLISQAFPRTWELFSEKQK